MNAPALFRLVWLLGGLALVLGWGRETLLGLLPRPRELPRLDNRTGQPWLQGEFTRDDRLAPGQLPLHLRTASSHVGGDDFTGRAETAWFKASRRTLFAGVAGYPNRSGCTVWAEFIDPAGTITRVECRMPDPREEWAIWTIARPVGAVAVRIIAEDRATKWGGWVAISHPFRAWPPEFEAVYSFFQVVTTLALALTLVWGPGLCWGAPSAPAAIRAVWFLGAGPLSLAAAGAAIWTAGTWVPPTILGTVLVAGLWLATGWQGWRRDFRLPGDGHLGRALALAALVVAAVAARASYSTGPEGELFQGTVSRNLALSDRIDSRFSFYAVQAATHHWGPASPITEKFYYPWTYFSRGPLAGLAATPMVMATNGRPPAVHAEDVWSPFDPTGFAAYRLTKYALAGSVFVAFYLLLLPLVGGSWALIGCGLAALAPFGVHEVMFTWPKWEATAWLVTAFALVHAGRPAVAGLALGVGFLFHPMVLLWSPWLACWCIGGPPAGGASRAALARVGRIALGAAALVLPWMLLGRLMPHLPDTPFAGQGNFLRYWILADSAPATWHSWWLTRWMNFANTFVPLHLFVSEYSFHHFRFSSAYETSGPLAKATFLWWNSLPFALGLGLWFAALLASVRGLRLLRAATVLLLIGPAVMLVAYWGGDPLGLMRECGHPLFLAVIACTVVVASRQEGRLRRWLAHPAVPWLQLPETWAMLWLAALGNTHPAPAFHAQLNGLYFVLNALALAAAAWVPPRVRRSPASVPAT